MPNLRVALRRSSRQRAVARIVACALRALTLDILQIRLILPPVR
jgi:hypothetical protein